MEQTTLKCGVQAVTVSEGDKLSFIEEALSDRKMTNRLRELVSFQPGNDGILVNKNGSRLIDFSSNDYLGLAHHPEVISRARDFAERYGTGSRASRLISGTYEIHTQLEEKLAKLFGTEAALLFNSGFQANSTIIGTLTDRNSLVLADKLSHNSLLQGALLSRADFQRFEHNDTEHLGKLLEKAEEKSYSRVVVVTETVFSMDGDRGPVREITRLTQKHNALLYVDDAHAVGVWGPKGLGLGSDLPEVDVLLGTCGKAIGTFGAYVACSKKMRDYLVNFCPGFIYTTSLPPAVIGAVDAALDIMPTMEQERRAYHDNITRVRQAIREYGFYTGTSDSQIIPIILGNEVQTLDLASWLEGRGILATAIRPPTVPEQSSRIRITLSLKHSDEHIEQFLKALKEWKRANG